LVEFSEGREEDAEKLAVIEKKLDYRHVAISISRKKIGPEFRREFKISDVMEEEGTVVVGE
jgi:hypothetical protein